MVRRLVSFLDGFLAGATLASGRYIQIYIYISRSNSPSTLLSGLGGLFDLRRSCLAGMVKGNTSQVVFWSRKDVPEICVQIRRVLDLHVLCIFYLFCCFVWYLFFFCSSVGIFIYFMPF